MDLMLPYKLEEPLDSQLDLSLQSFHPGRTIHRRVNLTVAARRPECPRSAAARRIQCVNHLKQLCLAVQNYESVHRVYPASAIVDPPLLDPPNDPPQTLDLRSGKMFSWAVLVLPYVEESARHASFDFNRTIFDQPQEAQRETFATMLCPSDSARGKYFERSELTFGKRVAKGNFGNQGVSCFRRYL